MIIWFSGNGNSEWVARHIAERLEETTCRIDRAFYDNPHIEAGERFIWIFPVHSWGVPMTVRSVIKRINDVGGKHFMVCTMGDDCGETAEMFRHDILSRGWQLGGAWSVIMPNTYVCFPFFDVDSQTVEHAKISSAGPRVDAIADAIASGSEAVDVKRGSFPRIKTRLIYPGFTKNINPNSFHANDKCIGCGRCVRQCPLENITLVNARPVWGELCALCLGCYNGCPSHAIEYGRFTHKKGQYRGPF